MTYNHFTIKAGWTNKFAKTCLNMFKPRQKEWINPALWGSIFRCRRFQVTMKSPIIVTFNGENGIALMNRQRRIGPCLFGLGDQILAYWVWIFVVTVCEPVLAKPFPRWNGSDTRGSLWGVAPCSTIVAKKHELNIFRPQNCGFSCEQSLVSTWTLNAQ